MNRVRPGAVALAILLATTAIAAGEALQEAVGRVIDSVEPRVVQLRYFGAGEDSIGAAGAPVTGYDLGGGWVLTSLYGLERAPAAIVCVLADGEQRSAEVVGRDKSRRVALVRLDGAEASSPPAINGRRAVVGETAVALGRVYTADSAVANVGIVSAIDRLGGRAVQTDALVSPTNYGGPLVGLDGQLLGVITTLAGPGMRGVDLYDSGIGFAVPAEQFAPRLAAMSRGETIQPGWLGAAFPNDDPLRAAAVVQSVADDSPAQAAGLADGDVLQSVDGQPVDSVWSLRRVLQGLDAGQRVTLLVRRDGDPASLEAVLAERPPNAQPSTLESVIKGAMKNPDEP